MKNVIIHIGPHKTGTTAIQHRLSQESNTLLDQGIIFHHTPEVHEAALLLANEKFNEAERSLKKIMETLNSKPEKNIILSQEDFSGNLIGRTRKRAVYPRLTKNIRVICRAFRPHAIKFIFFEREPIEWARSCYIQHLKHRTRFSNLNDFLDYYETDFQWKEKLRRPMEVVDSEFHIIEYSKEPSFGANKVMEIAGASIQNLSKQNGDCTPNQTPHKSIIASLERINRMTSFPETAWFSKKIVLDGWKPKPQPDATDLSPWPPEAGDNVRNPIPPLAIRVRNRVTKQTVTNMLPKANVDLVTLAANTLPSDVPPPDIPRARMEDQYRILEYHFRGKSKLAHLNALAISYLRRNTEYTELARMIFHRIWEEMGPIIVNELSTRWLISSLQTFIDHGKNEHQRMIGAAGFFYANMIKIYEGERSLEGLEPDATHNHISPQTPNKFRGLDRFSVGGTDLMLNTNALLLEISNRDEFAGLVLQEFLLRVKESENAFKRLDRTRAIKNIEVPGFTDTWSFFSPPKK